MLDTTIPAVLAGRNADAIAWSQAAVGDYVVLADPDDRAQGEVLYITELIHNRVDETRAYVNLVGNENVVLDVNYDRVSRYNVPRSFDHVTWQVWRVFPAAPEPRDMNMTVERALQTVNRLVTKHARANGLCADGVRAFRREVDRELGFEALPEVEPDVHLTCTIDFVLRGVSQDDIDVDDIGSYIASAVRMRTEGPGVEMVGGFDSIRLTWRTAEVTS